MCKLSGNRLHELRKRRGLSAEDLGRKANVSTRHVVRLENDERGAGSETLARLALALETSMEYLLNVIDDDRSIFTLADQQAQRPGTDSPPGKWLAGLHVPPHWEQAHGYEGGQRYIAIWWADQRDSVWIDDGQTHRSTNNKSLSDDLIRMLVRAGQSTTLDTLGYATSEASHCLLFDREERSVHHVPVEEARIWLEGHTDLSDKPPSSSKKTSSEAEACLHCDGQGWIRASERLEDGYVRCASCEGAKVVTEAVHYLQALGQTLSERYGGTLRALRVNAAGVLERIMEERRASGEVLEAVRRQLEAEEEKPADETVLNAAVLLARVGRALGLKDAEVRAALGEQTFNYALALEGQAEENEASD